MPNGSQESANFTAIIDIDPIIRKASENYGWNQEQSEYAKKWYQRYLYLCKKYPDKYIAAISHSADDLWRQHIIDTKSTLLIVRLYSVNF